MLFLLFQIGEARCALDAAAVLEIVPGVPLQPVPGAPAGVVGLLDYHATPVPVLDLCQLATGQPAPASFSTRLILVRTPGETGESGSQGVLGLLAERATSLLQRENADFTNPGLQVPAASYLGPVTTEGAGFIHRVSVERLLTGPVRALLTPAREEAWR